MDLPRRAPPALTEIETRDHIPGWLALNGFTRLAEVGVREGKHLQSLLRSKPEVMVAVDIWRDDGVPEHNDRGEKQPTLDRFYEDVCALAKNYPCLRVVREYSEKAALLFENGYFDFVYLDADHRYQSVANDISAWWPKVRRGGVIAGHDYVKAVVGVSKTRIGVVQAVTELAAFAGQAVHTTATRERFASWFLRKP